MICPKKIVLDTDIGGDCDDMGALAMLQNAQKVGKVKLLAVTISTANPYSAGCADAVNLYYGNEVPIGQTEIAPPGEDPSHFEEYYGKHIATLFRNSYVSSGKKKPENAVKLLRKLLAVNDADTGKITIVAIGSLTNIAGLLESVADEVSPLDGRSLIERSISELVVMGGYFPDGDEPKLKFGDFLPDAECNIKVDVGAAQKVFRSFPAAIVVSHYSIGWKMYTGAVLIEKERANPVAEAYFVHSHGNRDSWDPVAAYYAINGTDAYIQLSENGRVQVDDQGVTVFSQQNSGTHRLILCERRKETADRIDAMMLGELFQ